MKGKTKDIVSVSHDEYMIRELRKSPKFAAEYLKVALEDTEEPADRAAPHCGGQRRHCQGGQSRRH